MSNRRNSTTHSVASGASLASFNTDEDGSEMGHLSVSVSELNQLRQHVRNMRTNMTGRSKNTSSDPVPAPGTLSLEEVEIGRNGGTLGSTGPAGLIVSEDAMSPEDKRARFRLSIIGNIVFVLGAILYVCVAHGDLEWAKDIQGIPTNVLNADDDATWRTWQNQQQQGQQSKEHQRRSLKLGVHRALGMQKDEDQDFNNMFWADLPADIQLALMTLGHNRKSWNNAATSSIEEQPWSNLTAAQKDAAKIIGYTKAEWNDEQEEENKLWEATQEAYFATDGDDRAQDDRYEDDKAPDDDRRGGRNDDKYEDDKYEDEAPDDDRREDDRYEDEEDDRYEDKDDRYEDEDDQLPDDDKAATAGEVFDWYKESANDHNYPEDVGTGVVASRPTQAAQATVPPTTVPPTTPPPATDATQDKPQYTIDGAPIPETKQTQLTVAPEIPKDVTSPDDLMIWGEYDWEDLPDGVKEAFEILGYDEELWNTGGTAFTEDLYWADLTPPQQQQAGVLGYTQALWDQAEDEEYDITGGDQGDDQQEEGDDQQDEDEDDQYDEPQDDDQDPLVRLGYVEDDAESEAITLFFAAFCFMVAGVMNWIRERQVFHMWMVQGGVFGVLAALTMGFSDFAFLLLQTVSAHCFLLQSIFMLRLRKTIRPVEGLENFSRALWGADILFCAGAFLQVVQVYCLHADSDAYYAVGLGYCEVLAAWCWFFTASIYTMNTLALVNKRIEEDSHSRTLTIQRQHPNGDSYTIRPAAIQLREKPCHDVVLT